MSLKQFQTKNVMFNIIVDMYFDTVNWIKKNQINDLMYNILLLPNINCTRFTINVKKDQLI